MFYASRLKCVLCKTKKQNDSKYRVFIVRGSKTRKKNSTAIRLTIWFLEWPPGTTNNLYLIWNKTRSFFEKTNNIKDRTICSDSLSGYFFIHIGFSFPFHFFLCSVSTIFVFFFVSNWLNIRMKCYEKQAKQKYTSIANDK